MMMDGIEDVIDVREFGAISTPPIELPLRPISVLLRRLLTDGPEDEFDDAVNGDPDSLYGDDEADDEFDEMADWPDEVEEDDDEE